MLRELHLAIKSYMTIACLVAAAGCTVGPNYHRPSVDLQHKWVAPEAAHSSIPAMVDVPTSRPSTVQPGAELPEQWWTTLSDTTLNDLVDRAVRSNLDLRSAAARVRQARAQWAGAKAGLFPTANVGAGYDFEHNNGPLFPADTKDYNFYAAGFDATWELDVFGGTSRAIEEAGDSLQAQAEARRAVLVSLLAEVCRDYVELRTAQQRAVIAADNLRIARDSLALAQRLRAAGVAGDLDVTRAQAELTLTAANLPAFDITAKQSIHALGRTPGRIAGHAACPAVASRIHPATPSEGSGRASL
jgi:multidrug efflux system outer membrane protein